MRKYIICMGKYIICIYIYIYIYIHIYVYVYIYMWGSTPIGINTYDLFHMGTSQKQ